MRVRCTFVHRYSCQKFDDNTDKLAHELMESRSMSKYR